jgi:hypothetical protein
MVGDCVDNDVCRRPTALGHDGKRPNQNYEAIRASNAQPFSRSHDHVLDQYTGTKGRRT